MNQWLFALTLAVVIPTSAATLPHVTHDFMGRDWSSLSIEDVVRLTDTIGMMRELWAPVGQNQDCADIRTLTIFETVRKGRCERCLRLEFARANDGMTYTLTGAVLDYTATDRESVDAILSRLLTGSGAHFPGFRGRRTKDVAWSDSWSIRNEIRSVSLTVNRDSDGYHLHFDHRRYRAPGVPATPR